MNYKKELIEQINKEKQFNLSNLEKVVRLLDVLNYIFTVLDPTHSKLVFKGGTALNLIYLDLPRLSLDIDLDYIGSLDKETAFKDKSLISDLLDKHMLKQGYTLSNKDRSSVILLTRIYKYVNSAGNIDNIKIEINFIDRTHILKENNETIKRFNNEINVLVPNKIELYAMKLCALIDRAKARDLYDACNIFKQIGDIDLTILRRCIVFYLSLDGVYEINESTFKLIELINKQDIKKELIPVLSKKERFNLEAAKEFVISKLKDLLVLDDQEKDYLTEFSKGNYNPTLLFKGVNKEKLERHPMALWRIINIKKQ